MNEKRLMRSKNDRIFLGVAGGLARSFNVDPVLVRLGFVALGFLTHGAAVLLYLLLAFLMPEGQTGGKVNAFDPEEIVVKDAV